MFRRDVWESLEDKGNRTDPLKGGKEGKGIVEKVVRIKGMSCGHCVASVKKALEAIEGVTQVQVELERGEAKFSISQPASMEHVRRAIQEAGYDVEE